MLEPGGAHGLAVGDLVQVAFHVCGELVVHVVMEVLLEQPDHREGDPARDQRGTLLTHVAAVLDGGNGGRIGGRASDALLFQLGCQGSFRVARRRRGLMADGDDLRGREGVILGHVGEAAGFLGVIVPAAFVLAFLIGGEEAGEGDDGTGRRELGVAAVRSHRTEADGGRGALGVAHLGGNGALPDELVEPEFVTRELLSHLRRGAEGVAGGADGLVGFLRVGCLAGVNTGRLRHVLRAVEFGGLAPGSRHGFIAQRGRVRTHIGDVAVFVEALGHLHGALGGEPQLAARFLLQRGGGERSGRTAGVGLGVDGADTEFRVLQPGGQRRGKFLVQVRDVARGEFAVVVEVPAAGHLGAVDGSELRLE
ncbi:hypothetical protein D9M72_414540 [compost metagenome]